jgi:hypothetical protein
MLCFAIVHLTMNPHSPYNMAVSRSSRIWLTQTPAGWFRGMGAGSYTPPIFSADLPAIA